MVTAILIAHSGDIFSVNPKNGAWGIETHYWDVSGQEIMTADKVTLRVNLVVAYAVTDPVDAVTVVSDAEQSLYREAQLALRAAVGHPERERRGHAVR